MDTTHSDDVVRLDDIRDAPPEQRGKSPLVHLPDGKYRMSLVRELFPEYADIRREGSVLAVLVDECILDRLLDKVTEEAEAISPPDMEAALSSILARVQARIDFLPPVGVPVDSQQQTHSQRGELYLRDIAIRVCAILDE